MTIKTDTHGGRSYLVVHAEVPMIVRPKVKDIGEYYEDENGKTYVKELFDKFFNAEKRKVKNKFYKGEVIGSPFCDSI